MFHFLISKPNYLTPFPYATTMDMKILMLSISKSNFEINSDDHKMEKKR
jgi:hypothetical protein